MLLPIGSDQTTARRMPWVSFGIIAVCLLVFVATLIAPGDPEAMLEAEMRAVEYFVGHPYLEFPPQLKGYVYYSLRQQTGTDPDQPTDGDLLRRQQAELDQRVAAYFAARDAQPFWRWGLVPVDFQAPALITHQFVHAGLLHLLGNLFFFYLVGPAMEDVWGRPLFLGFYLLAGVAAALVFMARYPDLNEPLIGASGAIAGVMGAFAVRFWDSRLTFFYFVWMVRIYQGTFTAPAWLMLGLWAVGELAFAMGVWAFFSVADLGDVGFLAHVGGFVFGVGFAFLVAGMRVEERWVDPVVEKHEIVHESTLVDAWIEASNNGRTEEAIRGLERMLADNPADANAAAALWNLAVRARTPDRVVPSVLTAVANAARAGDAGLPTQVWAEMVRQAPDLEIDLRTAVRMTELLAREGLDGDVEATLAWLVRRVDASTPEGLLVRLARLADQISFQAPFAALALEKTDLDPALAVELQRFSGFSA
jgi:membrane associated rhomboid family serine protease